MATQQRTNTNIPLCCRFPSKSLLVDCSSRIALVSIRHTPCGIACGIARLRALLHTDIYCGIDCGPRYLHCGWPHIWINWYIVEEHCLTRAQTRIQCSVSLSRGFTYYFERNAVSVILCYSSPIAKTRIDIFTYLLDKTEPRGYRI